MELKKNLEAVREKIKASCHKSGRKPNDVRLIGITKSKPVEFIVESLKLGIRDIGESYVQEAISKIEELKKNLDESELKSINWHFVGGLQTNKIKYLKDDFSCVHSIDSIKQINEIDKRIDRKISIFFELNISSEESKKGTGLGSLRNLVEHLLAVNDKRLKDSKPKIKPLGLMCIPPFEENPELSRPYFRLLKSTLTEVNKEFNLDMTSLSMGMSNDFEIAIEEGATDIRLGTVLYGERNYK